MTARLAAYARLVCAWVMLLALSGAQAAAAQADVSLSALTIELWPEFDRPSVLVILRGTLAADVKLPVSITMHVPAESGGPSAVALQQADGSLVNAQYVTSDDAGAIAVTVQATTANFQIEYYDAGLTIADGARSYAFAWHSDWRVAAATLRIQEPRGASNLTGQPPVMLAGSSDLGLNYHTASLGALEVGQAVSAELHYDKATSELSVEEAPPMSIAPTAVVEAAMTPAAAPLSANDWRVWLGGGLLIGAVGLAGWGATRWRRARTPAAPVRSAPRVIVTPNAASSQRKAASPQHKAAPAQPVVSAARNFCTQCGRPLGQQDAFCRQCGAEAPARRRS